MFPKLKHIVIADDDEDDIAMFKDAVDEVCPTLQVITADNGVKLLSLLNRIPKPDAIVLDLNMHLKSGKECLEEIRLKKDFNQVPIAILSTSNSKQEIEYCFKRGADHYFVKPKSFDGMKSIVANICNAVLTHRL